MGGREKVLNLGFPRNDLLFSNDSSVKQKLKIKNYKRIIVWMPTFKHINVNIGRSDIKSNTDMSILDDTFIEKINNYLYELNSFLIIKYHPHQNLDYVKSLDLSNIKTMTNEDLDSINVSVYELMSVSDALITDFSSVYLDYLLTNRPIGFEIADIEKYTEGIGFLVDNPLDYMPGEKIKNQDDFYMFLKNLFAGNDKFKLQREELLYKMHDNIDGNSSKRILEYFNIK